MDQVDRPRTALRARRHVRRAGIGLAVASALLAGIAVGGALLLSGHPVVAPRWVTAEVEDRIDDALDGALRADLGRVELFLEEGWHPRIRLTGLRLIGPGGREAASIPDLRLVLDRDSLLLGQIRPASLRLPDVAVHLRRLEDGRFDVMLGASRGDFRALGSVPEVLGALDDLLAAPVLDRLAGISADRLRVTLDDAVTGRSWALSEGRLALAQTPAETRVALSFAIAAEGEGQAARAEVTFVTRRDSLAARLEAELTDVPAEHIAVQTPALAWLGLVDARVSGRLSAETDEAGALRPVTGQLALGPGRLSPSEGVRPIPFDGARLGFAYEPAHERIAFSEIAVDSPAMRLTATGQAFLQDFVGGLPGGLVAQMAISGLTADPDGVFDAPVEFSGGQADVKLRLSPFRLTIGQATLWQQDQHVTLSGRIDGAPEGWEAALDVAIDRIAHDRLLALWPAAVVPRTRDWLQQNVWAGELFNVQAAVRLVPGQEPRLSLGYEFDAAEARVLRSLPPIRDGAGRATMADTAYVMVVDRGRVDAPEGGAVDVAGTVFSVPNIREKPAVAHLDLRARGPVTAGLSLLDQPPFEFMAKAGKPVDLAEGQADVVAQATFPLLAHLPVQDVDYHVSARLTDVATDKVVPDRRLAAQELTLTADPAQLEIAGAGTLDGVPFTGRWIQPLTPEGRDASQVVADVPISPAARAAFAPGLPADLLKGQAQGRLTVDLAKGAEPRFSLTSDLRGAALALPALGWAKPAATPGLLSVAGRLGWPASIDRVAVTAPGLTVEDGAVRLSPAGGLDRATFGRVRLGGWLDAPVTLTGQGPGRAPAVSIPGGSLDIRKLPAPRGGTGGQGDAMPLDIALDRVTITPSLALTGFSGQLTAGAGVAGPFRARVNGGPVVTGTLSPSEIRVQGADAGAVLRAAGLTPRGSGGQFALTLQPRGNGDHDGALHVAGLRLRDAPLLVNLLSAISVVGLPDQLSGEGILFSDIDAAFRLTPGAVEIKRASATGPALGVTAAGVYLFAGQRMQMTGVVSPIYLLNGIGSLISGAGEGLFGFTYALGGTPDAPEVSVNPLSVLAPGPLRRLFQQPAPRLAP